ncbi:MAG: hypothetical protein COT45_04755 [bacterium (Candidatus Stahlbacteria) CG08_land_8_20_14_0_20_40_26]|nr:MAG: hypothetical protein COX49_08925 [bacterium (Candidatus Stahlbacteria) CG23_combo_of_CG06-09_8_20_14_all_40_9]PIS24128.1 MAG: hypothetical protein COT45_04755 [bacterium (Candidatus Stahlbacteria) CG08_land_8_20_14_0_20_40_26]
MKGHHRLDVWKRSIEFVSAIYRLTADFPDIEKFGLISQMRRSAVSISSNIAEGAGRGSKREFRNFLSYSQGSIAELETQLIISGQLKFIQKPELEPLLNELEEISRMVIGLQKTLKVN